MDALIRDRLNKIEDLQERRLLKEMLDGSFSEIIQYQKNFLQNIEDSVLQQLPASQNKYSVYTAVCKKKDYVSNNSFLQHVVRKDLERSVYDLEVIRKNLEEKTDVILDTVFLECESTSIEQLLTDSVQYQAEIITTHNTYIAPIKLAPSTKYLKPIEAIYHLFHFNKIDWRTVNNPYAFKFIDIILAELPPIPAREEVKEIKISLGSYDQYRKTDMILLWNVEHIVLSGGQFPESLEELESLEHRFYLTAEELEHGYLVHPSEAADFIALRQDNDKLVLISQRRQKQKWNIVKFNRPRTGNLSWLSYQAVSNRRKESFADRYAAKHKWTIRTRGELERIVHGFLAAEDLQLAEVKLQNPGSKEEDFNMNYFIEDDIRRSEDKEVMLLRFVSKNPTFITLEQVQFLISELQMHFPEYRWVGEMI